MKKLFTILSTVFLLASCAISDFETNSSPASGGTEQADSIGFFELTLSSVPSTRSTSTQITPEEAANFLVTIFKGSDIVRQTVRLADLNTSLPAGYGYTVQAESCSEADAESANGGWGQKRYAGLSASFAILAGKTTNVDVGCSVANSGVVLKYDTSLLNYFTSIELTVTSGERTLTFTEDGQTAYFNTDAENPRQATYTMKAVGPNGPVTSEGQFSLNKAKMQPIRLGYEIGTFELSILVEEYDLTDDEVVIHEEDIQTDDGKTEVNATFAGYTESARTDIHSYGQASVLLTAMSPIDWAQAESNVAVYDYTQDKQEFPASIVEGVQRLEGVVTPKTRDFLAAYPYSQVGDALSDGKIVFTLPAEQRALSVAPGTELASSKINYAVAKGQRSYDGSLLNLTFQPVCQVLQFQVPEYAAGRISAIQFTADTPVAGKLTVDVGGEKPTTAIASTESKSITILPPARESTFAAGTYYILTAPVQMNGFSMSFQCEGTGYTLSGTSALGGEAGKLYPLGYIDLVNNPEVTPAHQYSNNVLQGTKLTLTNAPIPGKQWNVTVKKGTTAVRNVSGSNNLSSPESDASWPYLPKGDYTAEYSFMNSNDTQSSGYSVGFSIDEDPVFSVGVSAYTSYSYYIGDVVSKNINSANACDNQTIYAPTVKISGISNSILNNSNYTFNIERSGFSSALKTSNNGVYVYNDFTQTDWKSYNLSAKVTFDGVSANSNTKTVHLTGLPYSATNSSGFSKWTGGQWKSDTPTAQARDGGECYYFRDKNIYSPKYHVPVTIEINLSFQVWLYCTILYRHTTYGPVSSTSNKPSAKEISPDNYTWTSESNTSLSLTTTNAYLGWTWNADAFGATYWWGIKNVSVTYR